MAELDRQDRSEKEAVAAAARILREHGEFIRTTLLFQAGGRFDVEDLFQGFFLILIQRPVPPEVRNLKSYLYRALVHYVFDVMRKTTCARRGLQEYALETRIFINNRTPENAFIEDEERDATIARAVRVLPEREAEAFLLRYRDKYSVAEIAAAMGVDRRTVSRYLAEGSKKLRRGLAVE